MLDVKVIMEYESFPYGIDIWSLLNFDSVVLDCTEVKDIRTGKRISFEEYAKYLTDNKLEDFLVEICNGSIIFGNSFNAELSKLEISNIFSNEKDVEAFIQPLILDDRFVQAYVYDREYDLWQNMEDIEYYNSEGRNYIGKPLISNGLPFPLERKIIDTSKNPGSWKFKKGYIESVSSTMWLGEKFWSKAGDNKEAVIKTDWLQIEELGSVTKLRLQGRPFTTSNGKEGILQNKLRNLLYK